MYKLSLALLKSLFLLGYNTRVKGSASASELNEIFDKWVRINLENRND